ncbi:toxin-antitoxin system YwqK family antitoxin [Streptomyces sp. NPDC059788]|uniref:toxin-antitoxin system YwqK family antitoxin n=1 Tax=Streptomyces sp. NPDC059788 TaxID=3346948 RepID=UPI0036614F70
MTVRIEYEDTYRDDAARVLCEDGLVTGEVVSRDQEGRITSLVSYHEGVPSGPQFAWYPDGTMKLEGLTRYGLAVGDWRKWYPNGQLAEHTVFNERGRRASRQKWDKEGNLTEDRTFSG